MHPCRKFSRRVEIFAYASPFRRNRAQLFPSGESSPRERFVRFLSSLAQIVVATFARLRTRSSRRVLENQFLKSTNKKKRKEQKKNKKKHHAKAREIFSVPTTLAKLERLARNEEEMIKPPLVEEEGSLRLDTVIASVYYPEIVSARD